jgi:hypothetical protein
MQSVGPFFPAARVLVQAKGLVVALSVFWSAVNMPGSGHWRGWVRDDRRDKA